jgi:hypothetical protein
MIADPQCPVQPPPGHEVVHVPVVAHTNVQLPPGHDSSQLASPRQLIAQLPPAHTYEQLALPSQVCWQLPPSQSAPHVPCEAHESQWPWGQLAVQMAAPHVAAGPVSGWPGFAPVSGPLVVPPSDRPGLGWGAPESGVGLLELPLTQLVWMSWSSSPCWQELGSPDWTAALQVCARSGRVHRGHFTASSVQGSLDPCTTVLVQAAAGKRKDSPRMKRPRHFIEASMRASISSRVPASIPSDHGQ